MPSAQGSDAVRCRSPTAHWPQALWLCMTVIALPTAPKQCGTALQEFYRPLPPGSVAVYCKGSTAHRPHAVRQCIAQVPKPTAPMP